MVTEGKPDHNYNASTTLLEGNNIGHLKNHFILHVRILRQHLANIRKRKQDKKHYTTDL